MTAAGDLRTIVVFQRKTETPDGYGGHSASWEAVVTTRGHYKVESARESLQTGRLESTARAMLRCRARSVEDVDASWRVMIDDVPWNIRGHMPFGQRGEWVDFIIDRGGDGVAV